MKRIKWLDGIKGLAAMGVFLHHFLVAFLPSTYYGFGSVSHVTNNLDATFAQSPLSVFVNGNFLVFVFCIISGLLATLSIMNMEHKNDLAKKFVRRYLTIAFPVFVVSLLVFVFLKFSLFTNIPAGALTGSEWLKMFYTDGDKISVFTVFISSFFKVIFQGDDTFSTAFWMLSKLFIGANLSMILAIIYLYYGKKSIYFYSFIAIGLICINSFYAIFALATILGFIMKEAIFTSKRYATVLGVFAVLLGLFLGGYPTAARPTNIYAIFRISPGNIDVIWLLHIIGACLFVFGVYLLPKVQQLFSSKIPMFFGKISFELYLLHIPFLFSFSTSAFIFFYTRTNQYLISTIIVFITSLILLIILSYLFKKFISPICFKISNKITNIKV